MRVNLWTLKKILYPIPLLISIAFLNSCKSYDTKNFIGSDSTKTVIANPVRDSTFTHDSTKKYIYFTFNVLHKPGNINFFNVVHHLYVKASDSIVSTNIAANNLMPK